MLEYRKPDLAYKEYLKAAEIVLNLIPSNLAFPDFKTRGHGWPLYQQLLKVRQTSSSSMKIQLR